MTCRFIKIYVLLLCGIFAAATFAQNTNSSIKGTVQDTHGAVIPGATVDLTNVGTGQQLSTTAGQDGFYTFSNLSPANYKITASAPGFASWVGILTLRVSQAAEVNPDLNAASVSTQVTVKDVTPVIDKVNPTISDVKEATRIETLPVLNRNILSVLAFSPGVVANSYGGSGGGYTRVNGVPGGSMDYLVDGMTSATKWSNELTQASQPTPTFQESKIITANGDAQYATPGVVELVTKSGTNQFHGQLFELNRNNILQARTFNSGPSIPYLMHNEYGGQLGGPIWLPKVYNGRNKTFFFVDLEGIREDAFAQNSAFTVPTAQQRTGDLSGFLGPDGVTPITFYDPSTTTYDPVSTGYKRTAFPGNKIPLSPVAAKIFSFMPLPNVPNAPYYTPGVPNYISPSAVISIRTKLYTAKVDQLFGPNRLAMRYTYTDSKLQEPSYFLNPYTIATGGHNGSLAFTEVISPKAVNVVHFGVQYTSHISGPVPISPSIPTQLGLPNYQNSIAWPAFYYDGYAGSLSGIDRDNPKAYPDQNATLSDQFTYTRGNHQLMAGFVVSNSRLTTKEVGQPGGSYEFFGDVTAQQNLAEAAQGIYDIADANSGGNCSGFEGPTNTTGCAAIGQFVLGDFDGTYLNVYPNYHTRQTQYAGFVQDDWRATQNLTLNLGLRYTYWTAFDDASGLMSTLDTSVAGGKVVYKGSGPLPAQTPQGVYQAFINAGLPIESAAAAHFPVSLWNMPKNNFEPRLGFAYQLGSKRVLRGGWGMYHWVMPLQQYQQATRKNPPFSYSQQNQLAYGPNNDTSLQGYDSAALEFPIASAQFGGPYPNVNYWMLGPNQPVLNESDVTISSGNFNMAPMNVNYKAPTVQEYNLTFEQELPGHFGLQLSYIGNHSYNLLQLDPINGALPQELCPSLGLPTNCTFGQRHAFPLFKGSSSSAMDLYRYDGYSNTNELQAQIQRNFGNGLTLQSYFTWQRTLTTTEDTYLGQSAIEVIPAALTAGYTPANFTSGAPYAERQRAVYANDSNLPDKTFSINGHYEFPFGRGKKYLANSHGFVNALVSGYNISPFFLWHSGFFFSPYFSSYGSNIILAPGKTGILPEGQRTTQHWFDYSLYNPTSGQPYAGQTYEVKADPQGGDFRNNIPRNYMTGPGFNQLDATIYKLTPLGKGSVLDIEAQIFNVYNHQNLGLPNTQGIISYPINQGSNQGGPVPRTIQLQAKFLF